MKWLLRYLAFAGVPLLAGEVAKVPHLTSRSLDIRLDAAARGALASVIDRQSGRDFIAPSKVKTLFRLTVADSGGQARELTAADAAKWEHSKSGDELVLRYRNLGGQELHVECRIRLPEGDTLSRWKIAVENRSPWSLRWVVYPVVPATPQLGPDWRDDRLISPAHSSGELRLSQGPPMHFPGGARLQYPGVVQVQFEGLYDATAGLYVASYDGGGNPKKIGYMQSAGVLDMSVQHEVWGRPGTNWTMPYEVVLGTFHGDWYQAADIYKQWARRQPWCARKLSERKDIPAWYLEGRPLVLFVPRGGEYNPADRPPRAPDLYRSRPPMPSPGLFPGAPALFADVSRVLRSPVVVIEYGWEKHGMWVTPDLFPPFGGDDVFRNHVTALRRNGHTVCCYISGTHWTLRKPGHDAYNGEPAFQRDGLAAVTTGEDQKPVIQTHGWATNARLCMGSPVTQKLLLGMVRGLVERGVNFVQYDQNVGGGSFVCHNRAHAHPPGYGRWMSDATRAFLTEARRLGKAADPDFVLTIEEPCEYFIGDVDGFNDRPYVTYPHSESVPVFNYLYHEYTLSFGGDSVVGVHCPETDLLKVARSFTAGMLVEGPTFGTSREWPKEELEFLASVVHAQRNFAHPYVILGEMLPAPRLERVPMIEASLLGYSRDVPTVVRTTEVPAVVASAWKSAAGRTGYVLANVLNREARPLLPLSGAGRWVKIWEAGRTRVTVRNGKAEIVLGPREVALVEQE